MSRRARTGRAWIAVIALLTLFALGCAPEERTVAATQVTLTIAIEPQLRAITKDLRVQIWVQGDKGWAKTEDHPIEDLPDVDAELESEQPTLDVVIVPRNDDASRVFEVIVEARDYNGQVIVQQRAVTSFKAHKNLGLPMLLEVCRGVDLGKVCETDSACHGPACRACTSDGCKSVTTMKPDTLPEVKDAAVPVMVDPDPCEPGQASCAFECTGKPRPKVTTTQKTATLKVQLLDYETSKPLRDVRVQACAADGTSCTKPTIKPEYTSGRFVVSGLPQGFDGFFTFEADGYLPVDFYTLRPLYDTVWETAPILMLAPALLETLEKYKVVSVDTTLGAIAVRVFDCYSAPAPGIGVDVTSADVLYLTGLLGIDKSAKVTDDSGQAVAFNIEEPEVTLSARVPRSATSPGKLLTARVLDPVPGRLTYVHVYPDQK